MWLSMKRFMEKKKEKQAAGEVRLQYRFIPNLTTDATVSSGVPVSSNSSLLSNLGSATDEPPLSL